MLEENMYTTNTFTIMETYQVNVSTSVDDEVTPWISEWSEDGYVGVLTDTIYEDGCDSTNWCIFTGSYKECEDYIAEHY